MKKKIVAIILAVALIAVAAVSASLAYLTDSDKAENVFTVGNVTIKLIEEERDGNGGKKDFTQNKKLYPIVGSAQDDKDALGMPTAKNYVDKMVTIKNTGSEDAYIRAYFAIPSFLDDGEDTFNAGLNVLHFNFGNKVAEDGTVTSTYGKEWNWKHDGKWNYFETTIDGVAYNVYFADYTEIVPAGKTTEQFVQGVYLDKTFNLKDGKCYVTRNGVEREVVLPTGWDWSKVSCPVYAIACQTQGFDTAAKAFNEAFGANYNPWGTPATNWQ